MKQLPPGSPKNGMLPSAEHRAQGTERRAQSSGHRVQGAELRAQSTGRRVKDLEMKGPQDNVSCIIGDVL